MCLSTSLYISELSAGAVVLGKRKHELEGESSTDIDGNEMVMEPSHTLSFTAAVAIHTLGNTFPGSIHIPDLCYTLTVAIFICHGN